MKKELKLKNQISELERVNQFVEEIGDELGLDMELQMNLNLVMRSASVIIVVFFIVAKVYNNSDLCKFWYAFCCYFFRNSIKN